MESGLAICPSKPGQEAIQEEVGMVVDRLRELMASGLELWVRSGAEGSAWMVPGCYSRERRCL